MGDIFGFLGCAFIIWLIYIISKNIKDDPDIEKKQKEFEAQKILRTLGPLSPQYICPHCQQRGSVHTIPVKRKKGVSGAKVTGALLTMGVSILATGLSRKEGLTQAYCGNCNSTWDF